MPSLNKFLEPFEEQLKPEHAIDKEYRLSADSVRLRNLLSSLNDCSSNCLDLRLESTANYLAAASSFISKDRKCRPGAVNPGTSQRAESCAGDHDFFREFKVIEQFFFYGGSSCSAHF